MVSCDMMGWSGSAGVMGSGGLIWWSGRDDGLIWYSDVVVCSGF